MFFLLSKKKPNTKEWPIRIFGTMRFWVWIFLSNIFLGGSQQNLGGGFKHFLFSPLLGVS